MKTNNLIDTINNKYKDIDNKLKQAKESIRLVDISFQSMLKTFNKLDKIVNNIPKRQTVLHKQQNISEELANFLNLDKNYILSRQKAVKMITQYCANMGLKNENNGRLVNLNPTLIKLFDLQNEQTKKRTIYIIEIDKFIKHHFIS